MSVFLFIAGHQCSGKSYLSGLLQEYNSDVYVCPGRIHKFLRCNLSAKYGKECLDNSKLEELYLDLQKERLISSDDLTFEQLESCALARNFTNIYDIAEMLFELVTQRQGKFTIWIIDNRLNSNFLGDILDINSNAKVLHVVREPCDLACAIKSERKNTHRYRKIQYYDFVRSLYWSDYVNVLYAIERRYKSRFLTIRYEDIKKDAVSILKIVDDFVLKNTNIYRGELVRLESFSGGGVYTYISSKHHQRLGYSERDLFKLMVGNTVCFAFNGLLISVFWSDKKFNIVRAKRLYKLLKRLKYKIKFLGEKLGSFKKSERKNQTKDY